MHGRSHCPPSGCGVPILAFKPHPCSLSHTLASSHRCFEIVFDRCRLRQVSIPGPKFACHSLHVAPSPTPSRDHGPCCAALRAPLITRPPLRVLRVLQHQANAGPRAQPPRPPPQRASARRVTRPRRAPRACAPAPTRLRGPRRRGRAPRRRATRCLARVGGVGGGGRGARGKGAFGRAGVRASLHARAPARQLCVCVCVCVGICGCTCIHAFVVSATPTYTPGPGSPPAGGHACGGCTEPHQHRRGGPRRQRGRAPYRRPEPRRLAPPAAPASQPCPPPRAPRRPRRPRRRRAPRRPARRRARAPRPRPRLRGVGVGVASAGGQLVARAAAMQSRLSARPSNHTDRAFGLWEGAKPPASPPLPSTARAPAAPPSVAPMAAPESVWALGRLSSSPPGGAAAASRSREGAC
jgi:hypothetical protein